MAARDIVVIGVLLFIFGAGFFILNFFTHTMVDRIVSVPAVNESTATVEAFEGVGETVNRLDYVFLGLMIGLALALIITGWLVGGEPIFMAIYFIIVIVAVLLTNFLAYFWDVFSNASVFGVTLSYFPITNHILNNLPLYTAIVGIIGIVVMFAKPSRETVIA